MIAEIEEVIISCLVELNEELKSEELIEPTSNTRLYGIGGVLESIMLVSLIADLEEEISVKFGKDIVLADERTMSQRTSPFRNVQSLSKYVLTVLESSID